MSLLINGSENNQKTTQEKKRPQFQIVNSEK